MSKWILKNKLYVLMGFIIICMLGIYLFIPFEKNAAENTTEKNWNDPKELENNLIDNPIEIETNSNNVNLPEKMWIDIKGAVMSPGVYEVNTGERVIDAIKLAGGLLDNADQNNVNFAMKVVDEMVLYIPTVGEQMTGTMETVTIPQEGNDKVNINTASDVELQTLPGIGESKAAAIMEYRDKNGPFSKVDDIMKISGIGVKTFEKLEEHIIVK